MKYTEQDIDLLFTPQHINPERFTDIRSLANQLGKTILQHGGTNSDIERSLQRLRECVFYAIEAISVLPLSNEV